MLGRMRPASLIASLLWTVLTGFAITGILVAIKQPTWVHFAIAAGVAAVVSVPISMRIGKAIE